MKKIIAFDQDDTLNVTKLPIDPIMAKTLLKLLDKYEICIISGTNWEVMRKNDIDTLTGATSEQLKKIHVMPTTGTQYWRYDEGVGDWEQKYAHFLTDEQVQKVTALLEKGMKEFGYWCENPAGEIIENRLSQITMSALGQWATPEDKHAWDPDSSKRKQVIASIENEINEMGLEVHYGGATSIDVTMPGIDKAYGMRQLMKATGCTQEEILFIGDKLQEGGNDYPVRAMGIDWIEVTNWKECIYVLQGILAVS